MDTKKILVISDVHGNRSKLKQVFTWVMNNAVYDSVIRDVIFLGDGILDLYPAAEETGFYCNLNPVRGNNDYGSEIPEAAVYKFEGHKFFLCHGHRYALYNGYNTLINAAKNAGADTALFGHLHMPYDKRTNGIRLINPGSIGNPRSKIGASFAVIESAAGKSFNVRFWGVGAQISEITLPGH
jgi:putative phosphoesterase